MMLNIYFASRITRAAALMATKEINGEDGWASENTEACPAISGKVYKYKASINCSEKRDAVKTWANMQTSFVEYIGEILTPSEALPEFVEEEA